MKYASGLTDDERETLDRLRQPVVERASQPSDGIWLRTCYGSGPEATFSALKQSHLDRLCHAVVLDDASLYDFGPGEWQRIFCRMPQLLDGERSSAQDYKEKHERHCSRPTRVKKMTRFKLRKLATIQTRMQHLGHIFTKAITGHCVFGVLLLLMTSLSRPIMRTWRAARF